MMLTNEIEHYMQQWNYINIRQAKTNKNTIFMFCSDMSELLIVTDSWTPKKICKIQHNITMYNMITM